jgi:hypothetical protein
MYFYLKQKEEQQQTIFLIEIQTKFKAFGSTSYIQVTLEERCLVVVIL